jgi:hypothetical protein
MVSFIRRTKVLGDDGGMILGTGGWLSKPVDPTCFEVAAGELDSTTVSAVDIVEGN